MKLSVCIEMVFSNPVFTDRIPQVKESGIEYFEFWGWGGKDLEAIKSSSQECGVKPSVFGCSGGSLVDSANRGEFLKGVEESIEVARDLGVSRLIATTGNELHGVSRDAQHNSVVEGLRAAAPLLEAAGITLVVEPLNLLVDHAGYFLASSDEGFSIVDEVGSPCVKLLFDIYHQQITEGHIIKRITSNIARIGHFHVADNPGRNEPGTGELNYRNIFKAIRETGYEGFIGLEYHPKADPVATLRSVKALLGE